MDALALFGAGVASCGLAVVAVGLVIRDRNLNRRLAATERLVDQLTRNTKAIEPTRAALDDERDFQEALLSLKLLMGYVNRKSPGALKLLIDEEFAPHRVSPTRRAN